MWGRKKEKAQAGSALVRKGANRRRLFGEEGKDGGQKRDRDAAEASAQGDQSGSRYQADGAGC